MKLPPYLRVVHGIKQRVLSAEEGLEARAIVTALVAQCPAMEPVLPMLLEVVDRATTASDRWDFVMINPDNLVAVLRLIRTEAKRPKVSAALWEEIILALDKSTGAVVATREQLAERVGQPVNIVSAALSEFVRWNVLRRFQSGRSALWVFNPNIGTRLGGAAGDAARKAAGPVLHLVSGGKDQGVIADPRQPSLV